MESSAPGVTGRVPEQRVVLFHSQDGTCLLHEVTFLAAPSHCWCIWILGFIFESDFFSYEVLLRQCVPPSCVLDIFSWLFESKHRYLCISIKCHILLFDPFVLAQSFQTLFLSFVPWYISLGIVLFANLVDMSSLSFKLLIKNNVEYQEIGEREGAKASKPWSIPSENSFPNDTGLKFLGKDCSVN